MQLEYPQPDNRFLALALLQFPPSVSTGGAVYAIGGHYFFCLFSLHLNNSSVFIKFVKPFFSNPFFSSLSPVQILQRKCFEKATY